MRKLILLCLLPFALCGCERDTETIHDEVSRRIEMKPELFRNALTYSLLGMVRVVVQNVEYRNVDDAHLTMDIYYPPTTKADGRLPVVIFVMGYSDSVARLLVGSPLKDFGQYLSWSRLTAASGLIAITYQTHQPDDLEALVEYIRRNAASLNVDADRVGIWACSGNVPAAISFIMQDDREYVKFAVFYYGFMLTPDNELREQVNEQCASLGCFAAQLGDLKGLRKDLPLFIVRAGLESHPYLNESIDHFVSVVAEEDVPLTFIDYAEGIHGFDVKEFWTTTPHDRSGEIVRQTLEFMRSSLAID